MNNSIIITLLLSFGLIAFSIADQCLGTKHYPAGVVTAKEHIIYTDDDGSNETHHWHVAVVGEGMHVVADIKKQQYDQVQIGDKVWVTIIEGYFTDHWYSIDVNKLEK